MIRRPPRSTPLSLHDALPIFVVARELVQRRPDAVDDAGRVPREELEREQRGSAARRALVLEPAAQQLDLLAVRSEEHTSELQSQSNLVCRLLLEKKKKKYKQT